MIGELLQGAISAFLGFVQMRPEQVIGILSIPIFIDLPRTLGKTVLLFAHRAHELLTSKSGEESRIHTGPLASVIVPAHNEEEAIEKTVQSLLEQDYPRKEVIVVDDGSTDRTFNLAQRFAEDGLIRLIHRERASGKKARAVNHGVLFSNGDIIVTLDADTMVEPYSLSELMKPFRDPAVGAVSGNIRVLNCVNLLTKLQAYEYLVAMEMGRRFQAIAGSLMIIPGALGAVRRSLAASLGLYDVDTVTEDFDITVKIHKSKTKVRFAVNAIGWTMVPTSWRAWTKQRTRWTAGQLQTLVKHHNLFLRRHFGFIGLVATPDMLSMDVILLFVRTIWLVAILLLRLGSIPALFILILSFYFCNEVLMASAAALLSPRKRDLIYLSLVPIIVLFYRPLYGLIRMKAYLDVLTGQTFGW